MQPVIAVTDARRSRPLRRKMIRRQVRARGISDLRVLAALASVPREAFVAPEYRNRAYEDTPLPARKGQTISQPYIVALMTMEARLNRHSRVLEIGTGTGYHTAVLARIAAYVWTIERHRELSVEAEQRLMELGLRNICCVIGDGARGYPEAAPYDAIVAAAAAPGAPRPLLEQLAPAGRLVIPIGDRGLQELMVFERTNGGFHEHSAGPCRFVPLISPEAFSEEI